jgi:hypothetical protein
MRLGIARFDRDCDEAPCCSIPAAMALLSANKSARAGGTATAIEGLKRLKRNPCSASLAGVCDPNNLPHASRIY